MPRRAINNPTERILRLLEEMEDLVYCMDQYLDALGANLPELLQHLPTRPPLLEYHLEMQRQAGNYRKPLDERRAEVQRRAMARYRIRGGSARDVGQREHEELRKFGAQMGTEIPEARRTEEYLTTEEKIAKIKREEREEQLVKLNKILKRDEPQLSGDFLEADTIAKKLNKDNFSVG